MKFTNSQKEERKCDNVTERIPSKSFPYVRTANPKSLVGTRPSPYFNFSSNGSIISTVFKNRRKSLNLATF